VRGEDVLVSEQALDRISVVDPVGARQGAEDVGGLGALLHRPGHVAREAELLLDPDDEPRRVGHGPRARHAELHGREVAHARRGVAGAPLRDGRDGELDGGPRVLGPFTKRGHQGAGATHRLVAGDAGEAAPAVRPHARAPAAWGMPARGIAE
jgi:ribosomal protein L34